jgi:hypothetical protein
MGLHEITIQRKDDQRAVDMQAVYAALKDAGVDFDPEARRTNAYGYERQTNEAYVYVQSGSIGKALNAIDELGYSAEEYEAEEYEDEEEDDNE